MRWRAHTHVSLSARVYVYECECVSVCRNSVCVPDNTLWESQTSNPRNGLSSLEYPVSTAPRVPLYHRVPLECALRDV